MSMENRKIKVAQVIGAAFDGGVEACIMNYYTHIDKEKIQFDFFVESTSKIIDREKIEQLGGRVVIIPPYKHLVQYVRELKALFKKGNYDIVHSNMNALSVFTLFAAKKAGVQNRIAHSHSTSNKKEWKRNIIKNLLRPFSKIYATHYFACSELAGRWLFGNKTYDKGKVTIVNNAIDLNKFAFNQKSREEIRKEWGLESKFIVGNIGRLVTQKNQTFLLDIFYEYQKLNDNAVLLMLGNGPLKEELERKVDDLHIQDKVFFAGVHSNPEKFYSAMDCFLLPSLYEGLPVVGIEAQVSGLAMFASDTVTKETKLVDAFSFISLSKTADEWAKIIYEFDWNLDRKIGYNQIKGSKYDIDQEAKKLLDNYENIVRGENV